MMRKFTFNLEISAVLVLCLAFYMFSAFKYPENSFTIIQEILNRHYNKEALAEPIKSYELKVTNNGFCRYRKVLMSGKEEFYAFNLTKLKSINYYGNTQNGELWLNTINDDIIVQTRRDKKGDVDSMSTYLSIPLKDIDVEQLNELSSQMQKLKNN